jgi:hypothetical protein
VTKRQLPLEWKRIGGSFKQAGFRWIANYFAELAWSRASKLLAGESEPGRG